MTISIKSVEHDSEAGFGLSADEVFQFILVKFSVDGEDYEHALNDGKRLDRSNLDFDSDTLDAIQEALDAFIDAHDIDTEPYGIDELTVRAQLFGYQLGKRYMLDEIGKTVELVELTERYRKRVTAFNSREECALWLSAQLKEPLEKGPIKRVNANIPEALHDDFKALCVRRQVDMQDVLPELIIRWMQ